MGFKCGIVGLPNVGKSTLFNALTASKNAEAANFPFCTIDPNIGIVDVVDERLDKLSKLSNSKRSPETSTPFDLVKQTNSLFEFSWSDFAIAELEPIKTTLDMQII